MFGLGILGWGGRDGMGEGDRMDHDHGMVWKEGHTPSWEARTRVKMTQPTPAASSSRTRARTTAPAVFMVWVVCCWMSSRSMRGLRRSIGMRERAGRHWGRGDISALTAGSWLGDGRNESASWEVCCGPAACVTLWLLATFGRSRRAREPASSSPSTHLRAPPMPSLHRSIYLFVYDYIVLSVRRGPERTV